MICLLCDMECKNSRSLAAHIRYDLGSELLREAGKM